MDVKPECDSNSSNVSIISDVKSEPTDFVVDEVEETIQCKEKDKITKQEVNEVNTALVKDEKVDHEGDGDNVSVIIPDQFYI